MFVRIVLVILLAPFFVLAKGPKVKTTHSNLDQFVNIKGGEFIPLYGSAGKTVLVDSFVVSKFPVTNFQFLQFVNQHPEWSRDKVKRIFSDDKYLHHWKSSSELGSRAPGNSPVVSVSWYAAKAYCESLGFRLPTVNEWEYVASFPINGSDPKKIILEWYSQPTPDVLPSVFSGKENSQKVASMHGLIWEWTLDFNSAMVTGESRADGSLDKTLFCGSGSANAADKDDYAAFLRYGFRSSLKANYTVNNLGFRCVKEEVKP